MEYNLLKTIEPSVSSFYVPNESYPRLTAYPATDYVNPGLGQICRLYSFYVPLYAQKSLYSVQKKQESTSAETLEGFGNVVDEKQNKNESTNEKLNESDEIAEQLKSDPILYNSQKLKRLGPALQESFQHPKLIKTDKILLSQSEFKPKVPKYKTDKNVPKKTIQHKFNVF